jgi:hypothetical protein
MKDEIFLLRSRGKSYREISKILNCSKATVNYYLTEGGKAKVLKRQQKNRPDKRIKLRKKYRDLFNSSCCVCGYSKCTGALHFHHLDPKTKKFTITDAVHGRVRATEEEIYEEIAKCILVCANCHAEIHLNKYEIIIDQDYII